MRDLSSLSDSELLRASVRDAEAFHIFYRRHCVAIDGWLRRQTGNLDAAAELTAETFAQAWFGARRFQGDADGDGTRWLFGIARNLARQYFRRRRVELDACRKLSLDLEATLSGEDALEQVARHASAPELRRALEGLPEHERNALLLRVLSELSYREIAGRLHCSENAARLRVSRALRGLRARLRRSCAATAETRFNGGAHE
jgi:RNA polymerase sigma-70 factor (ECF subfamily)